MSAASVISPEMPEKQSKYANSMVEFSNRRGRLLRSQPTGIICVSRVCQVSVRRCKISMTSGEGLSLRVPRRVGRSNLFFQTHRLLRRFTPRNDRNPKIPRVSNTRSSSFFLGFLPQSQIATNLVEERLVQRVQFTGTLTGSALVTYEEKVDGAVEK